MRAYPGRLLFDHLAKTGGQAINAWLTYALGTACVTPPIISEHRRAIRQFGGTYSVISGHISFDPGDELDPRYRYVTLLREPVDRALSWLYYLRGHVDEAGMAGHLVRAAKAFLDTEGGECSPELRDSIAGLAVEHFSKIGPALPTTPEAKVAAALEALRQYDVVGRYDDLVDFAGRVADLIGIAAPRRLPRTNVTEERSGVDALSPPMRARVEALCELDLELWARIHSGGLRSARPYAPRSYRGNAWSRYDTPTRDVAEPGVALSFVSGPAGERARAGETMDFVAEITVAHDVRDLVVGLHIFDEYGNFAFGTNSELLQQSHTASSQAPLRVTFSVVANLPVGRYTVGFSANDGRSVGGRRLVWYDRLGQFEVVPAVAEPHAGYSYLHPRLVVEPAG